MYDKQPKNPHLPKNIDELANGQRAHVAFVQLAGSLGDRLVELGMTPGARVQLLRRAPFGGPLQLQVRDFVLSLRRAEARAIAVVLLDDTAVEIAR